MGEYWENIFSIRNSLAVSEKVVRDSIKLVIQKGFRDQCEVERLLLFTRAELSKGET